MNCADAYYNECDPQKVAWLNELIREGVIAPGYVDARSIIEVTARDLRSFTQCHFFAGIGVWSYALRLAGWPDDRPVWTGSCPCPSFSCAGKGQGFDDPRHLWPAWLRLIAECNPPTIFGEQTDDAIGFGWLDLVQTDLEREAYAVGKAVLGACSVGAPHIRQRLYFCAYHLQGRFEQLTPAWLHAPGTSGNDVDGRGDAARLSAHAQTPEILARSRKVQAGSRSDATVRPGDDGGVCRSSDSASSRHTPAREFGNGLSLLSARPEQCRGTGVGSDAEHPGHDRPRRPATIPHRNQSQERIPERNRAAGRRPNSDGRITRDRDSQRSGKQRLLAEDSRAREREHSEVGGLPMCGSTSRIPGHAALAGEAGGVSDTAGARLQERTDQRGVSIQAMGAHERKKINGTSATRGFWADCDWWYGRDGKYRPIEPGLFPLAHGAANRVLKLRGFGDAIVPQVAKEFIQASEEAINPT